MSSADQLRPSADAGTNRRGRVRRRIGLTALAAALVLVVAACGDDEAVSAPDGAGATTTTAATEPTGPPADGEVCTAERIGGSITMGTFANTANFDPIISAGGSTGSIELAAVYGTLMRWNADTAAFEPSLAEDLQHDGSFGTWTLTLRDDVEFANGDLMTADHVKASIERFRSDQATTPRRGQVALIAEIEVVDERTVVFELATPWATFPTVLSDLPGMIVNPAVVEQQGEDFNIDPVPAGAGPYEVARFMPGEEAVLRTKTDWWGGPVCIEEIRFVSFPGADRTYEEFLAEGIDVAFLREAPSIDRARQGDDPNIGFMKHSGDLLLINVGIGDPPTADVRLRQAIAHAIDPEVVNERAYEGKVKATGAVIHEDSDFYSGVPGPEHDPERAAELVQELKDEGWDGRLHFVCNNPPARQQTALAVATLLQAVGIDVELDNALDTQEMVRRVLVEQDFHMTCWGVSIEEAAIYWSLNFLNTGAGNNYGQFSDPDMDEALAELRVAQTVEEHQAALAKVQTLWNELVPSIVLGTAEDLIVWKDHIRGLRFSNISIVMFDQAYLDR